jgi:hypothetical protein
MRRVVLALLGEAVLFAALIFWIGSGNRGFAAGQGALGVFVSVLMVGFPSLYYCCQRGLWDAWRFVLLGALGGLLCALPLYGGPYLFGFLLLLFVLAGAAFGALFWLTAIWRNLDLTCPKTICLPCGTVYKVARKAFSRQSK